MVWAGISRGGRTDPHIVIQGMMTGLCYRGDMMDVYVRPYAGAIGTSSSSWTTTLDFIVEWWLRVPPAGDHRPYGLASMLTLSQPDRACLEHDTGGDCATSIPTNDSRGT